MLQVSYVGTRKRSARNLAGGRSGVVQSILVRLVPTAVVGTIQYLKSARADVQVAKSLKPRYLVVGVGGVVASRGFAATYQAVFMFRHDAFCSWQTLKWENVKN
jgi:hypothetical protein